MSCPLALLIPSYISKTVTDVLCRQIYVKSAPETTYPELERAFRAQDVPLWLIAIEKPGLAATLTNMDLQGNLGKKYTVTYRFQWNPPRPRDRELWPANVDENIERLQDAGEVVERGVPMCRNCGELGHIAKSCPQEKFEKDRVEIRCYNCDEIGHRVRDCKTRPPIVSDDMVTEMQVPSRELTSSPARTASRC